MSADPNAPVSPPMLSPDRKWVWNGSQWLPVADPSAPAHQSVFPAYDAVTRDVPAAVELPQPAPIQVPYAVGPPSRQAQPDGPLWGRQQTGLNKYLYLVAGGLVVVIGIVLVFQFTGLGSFTLPGRNTSTPQAAQPTPSLPLLTDRSDYARANRFLKSILGPAVADVNDTSGPVELGCHGALTVSCASALGPMDRSLKKMLAVIDANKAAVPSCIALNVANIRRDVAAMIMNLEGIQNASDDNNPTAVKKDYVVYENWRRLLLADLKAAPTTPDAVCEAGVTGP